MTGERLVLETMRKLDRLNVAAGALICEDPIVMSDLVSDVPSDGEIPVIWSCKERGDVQRCFASMIGHTHVMLNPP